MTTVQMVPRDCPSTDCPMDAAGHCRRCDRPKFLRRLTDDDIQMFDRALIASSELIARVKV